MIRRRILSRSATSSSSKNGRLSRPFLACELDTRIYTAATRTEEVFQIESIIQLSFVNKYSSLMGSRVEAGRLRFCRLDDLTVAMVPLSSRLREDHGNWLVVFDQNGINRAVILPLSRASNIEVKEGDAHSHVHTPMSFCEFYLPFPFNVIEHALRGIGFYLPSQYSCIFYAGRKGTKV